MCRGVRVWRGASSSTAGGYSALIFCRVYRLHVGLLCYLSTLMTWPSINAVGRREPAYRRFTVPSAIAKYAVVVLVVCTIPGLVSSAQMSLGGSDAAVGWSLLSDQYTFTSERAEATIRDRTGARLLRPGHSACFGSLNHGTVFFCLMRWKTLRVWKAVDGRRSYGEPRVCGPSAATSWLCRSRTLRIAISLDLSLWCAEYSFHQKDREDRGIYLLTVEDKPKLVGVKVPALSS